MSLASALGLTELSRRTRGERATFVFLIVMSAFLFMDQNLMAPNLTAIGEELVVSRDEVTGELARTDPAFRQAAEQARALGPVAARFEGALAAARAQAGADADPAAVARALEAAADPAEVAAWHQAAKAKAAVDARITEAFQRQVDDRLAGRAALWFWMLGGFMALFVGYLTDKIARKRLLFATIIIGALPCLATGFARDVNEFVVLRALTGIGIGAVLPLTYSLIGDLFSSRSRAVAAAWVFLATGLGIAIGQLFAGIAGPTLGWRFPFIAVALPNLVLAFFFLIFSEEPRRGAAEAGVGELVSAGAEYKERLELSDLKAIFANKTNLLVFFQGIPGSMPWGFFFTYLVDFYHANKGYPVAEATLLVTLFGAGAILGGFTGGLLGGKLYNKDPRYLPMLCGFSVLLGMVPMFAIVNWSSAAAAPVPYAMEVLGRLHVPQAGALLGPMLLGVFGAAIATVTASNVKAVLINVNAPETRGTIFSIFNLADDLGKGLSPFIIGSVLAVALGRVAAFNIAIGMWFLCALAWFAMIRVFPRDLRRLEEELGRRARALGEAQPLPAGATGAAALAGHRRAAS